jgi:hypothetical protein
MDMLVAHPFSASVTLVTSERSFGNLLPRLLLADWAKPR